MALELEHRTRALSTIDNAHLAETRFDFLASTFLPITTQTPKHLGFGFSCHRNCAETLHLV
jgi:hypothetical protein